MSEKKVVLVTGSSGRIGKRLVTKLPSIYHRVGLDAIGSSTSDLDMEFIYVDLGCDRSVHHAFERVKKAYNGKVASIVHLAAYYSFSKADQHLYDQITVQGTRRLLDEAKRIDVEQFIFTSTMLVHEPTQRGIIQTEASPIQGKWAYPISKVKTEELIHQVHGQIPTVILRIGGCYDEMCNCVPLSQHIARIYEKQMTGYLFAGDVHHGVPYTHFDDLIDMILLVIERRHQLGKEATFLCVEEESITYKELQTLFGRLIHHCPDWPMFSMPKWFAKFGAFMMGLNPCGPPAFIKPWMIDLADDNYEFSMQHAKDVLGFSCKRKLRDALPKMVAQIKSDPVAWYQRHGIPLPKHVLKCCDSDVCKRKKS